MVHDVFFNTDTVPTLESGYRTLLIINRKSNLVFEAFCLAIVFERKDDVGILRGIAGLKFLQSMNNL